MRSGIVNPTLLKPLVGLLPTCVLLLASAIMFVREKRAWSVLQLIGAAGLVLAVLTHLCEALQLFSWMHWGLEHSVGHYLDLSSAVLGLTLFPIGHLVHALRKWHP
jgi:Ca2+/Na+ antiporter